MTEIHIFIPKKRRNDCNKRKWKFNHHKKPQYLISEINNAIRKSKDETLKILWRKHFKSKYRMKR